MKNRIGNDISILDGNEEALLSFRGALFGFPFLNNTAMVIDIGGGSTEVAAYPNNRIETISFPLGAVRLTERFLKDDPPDNQQISRAIQHIREELHKKPIRKSADNVLIGVAGTPTTLACLDQELTDYDFNAVEGYQLKYDRVRYWTNKLSSLSSSQIRAISRSAEGREDILTVASCILTEFMKLYSFSELLVSTRGLRYGIVLKEWERLFSNKTAV